MTSKKALLVDTLTPETLRAAGRRRADMVFANHIKLEETSIPGGIEVHDAFLDQYRQVSWAVFRRIEARLDAIAAHSPELLEVNGFDIRSALLKYLFWAYFPSSLSLEVAFELYRDAAQVSIEAEHLTPPSRIRKVLYGLRIANQLIRGLWHRSPSVGNPNSMSHARVEYVFWIDSLFVLALIKRLLLQFEPQHTLIVVSKSNEEFEGNEEFQLLLKKGYRHAYISYDQHANSVFPKGAPKRSWLAGGEILYHALRFRGLADAFEKQFYPVIRLQPKAIITCAAENLWEGHMLCAYGQKNGIKIVNLMNGLKDGGADSAYAAFDLWFAWDEKMIDILCKHAHLPASMFTAAGGHLAEDTIAHHTYSGSLDSCHEMLAQSRVILFISIPGRSLSKSQALKGLYALMDENPEIQLIYRPHPREKAADYHLPSSEDCRRRVHVLANFAHQAKASLYDQFLFSDLVVCMGSTVGVEAVWAEVPCITYEEKETSVLYLVDGERLVHVNTQAKLIQRVRAQLGAAALKTKPRLHLGKRSDADEHVPLVAEIYANAIRIVAEGTG